MTPMDYGLPGSSVHRIFQQEYWDGLSFPTSGYLPDPGIKPMSPAAPELEGGFLTIAPPGMPQRKRGQCSKIKQSVALLFQS